MTLNRAFLNSNWRKTPRFGPYLFPLGKQSPARFQSQFAATLATIISYSGHNPTTIGPKTVVWPDLRDNNGENHPNRPYQLGNCGACEAVPLFWHNRLLTA